MNLVYPLKTQSDLREINLSLKTVEKFVEGVDEIYVIGTQRVPGTVLVPMNDPHPRPTANTYRKAQKACSLMPRFLWMNDDVYFTRPIHVDEIQLVRNGSLPTGSRTGVASYAGEKRATGRYLESLGATTYSFEVHCPMPIVSEVFLRVVPENVCAGQEIVLWRSVYGNLCRFPSVDMPDNKIFYESKKRLDEMLQPFFVSSAARFHPLLLQWLSGL